MSDIIKILIVVIFIMISELATRMKNVETQLSRIQKVGD